MNALVVCFKALNDNLVLPKQMVDGQRIAMLAHLDNNENSFGEVSLGIPNVEQLRQLLNCQVFSSQ